jgi:hypothetical protein
MWTGMTAAIPEITMIAAQIGFLFLALVAYRSGWLWTCAILALALACLAGANLAEDGFRWAVAPALWSAMLGWRAAHLYADPVGHRRNVWPWVWRTENYMPIAAGAREAEAK